MHPFPSKSQAYAYAEAGYAIMPVAIELLCDFITPIELLRILKHVSHHVCLLESASDNEGYGRYSILGYDPRLEITCLDGQMRIGDVCLFTSDPFAQVRSLLARCKSPVVEGMPPFAGGLIGWFSYDCIGYAEVSAKRDVLDPDEFRDLDLMLFDKVIVFDHVRQKLMLIACMKLEDIEVSWNKTLLTLQQMKDLVLHGQKHPDVPGRLEGELVPLFDKEAYCAMVEKAREHIYEGDIFQIVLSNRLSAPFSGTLLDTYRMLRTINPSPYMFYFAGTDVEAAGASPETLVRLAQGRLTTFPLAGTRKRGKTPQEDLRLEQELLADEKELAEHNMLVDLGRNDLGRVAAPGSVQVDSLHDILRFSHVMHIGSTVSGQIAQDKDALDAIASVLPAGTLSGAPKIRACQLIGELEGVKRGIYGGAIGYLDFAGNMDMCIAIRLAYAKHGKVHVRSGAGIVADSIAEHEYEECLNKARASIAALLQAQEEL